MKRLTAIVLGIAAAFTASRSLANDAPLKGFLTVLPVVRSVPAPASLPSSAVKPLPSFQYSYKASADLGGGTYSGTIIGTSPFATTKTGVSIKTQIVPLVITINDGTTTVKYDPTAADSCNGGHTALATVAGSPIFTKDITWTMNGVKIGKGQYISAFQRAEFWSLVHGSNYYLYLQPVTMAKRAMQFTGSANGQNYTAGGGCAPLGIVNINDMDARIQALITGPLAASINAGTFPIFITKNVVMSTSGVSVSQCCVLGYHSGLTVGGNLQIYSPFSFDSTGYFGGDVSTLSHEMGEAINDPTTTNPTPTWGNIGQVSGGCQNNFEVGDPLSPGFGTPTKSFVEVGANGLTYHLQELAFISWFYNSKSLGAGGKFSDNGSFGGDAILCSAGGGTH